MSPSETAMDMSGDIHILVRCGKWELDVSRQMLCRISGDILL